MNPRSPNSKNLSSPVQSACAECQRRKQKCDRKWPCDHCTSRKVPQLCQYGSKTLSSVQNCSTGSKRTLDNDSNEHESTETTTNHVETADDFRKAFHSLGYGRNTFEQLLGQNNFNLFEPSLVTSKVEEQNSQRGYSQLVPPRPYADILVRNYLDFVNYHYYPIYPPEFMESYTQFWTDKTDGVVPNRDFTCLLLRVCACAAQFLSEDVESKIESEIGEKSQALSKRYHEAAQQLSQSIEPGRSRTQVQQLFLTASWLKSNAQYVAAWHVLSSAIREAQELALSSEPTTEFEIEMRRRIWCLLFTWDWSMSMMLSRPSIINQSSCDFELPNPHMESSKEKPDLPSPIMHIILQCSLAQKLAKKYGTILGITDNARVKAILEDVEDWASTLPETYREKNPVTKWDYSHQYIVFQRWQLLAAAYMNILGPLRPILTKRLDPETTGVEKDLFAAGIEYSLKTVHISQKLSTHLFPNRVRFHFAACLIFDTAATLCSTLIHNSDQDLLEREKIIDAIRISLDLLGKLNQAGAKPGTMAYEVVTKLVATIPLSSSEKNRIGLSDKSKRQKRSATSSVADTPSSALKGDIFIESTMPELGPVDNVHSGATPDSWQFTDTLSSLDGNLDDISHIDLGSLGQIWDWEMLNIGVSGTA